MEIIRENGFVCNNININIAVVKWKSSFENSLNNESKIKSMRNTKYVNWLHHLKLLILMVLIVINFSNKRSSSWY